MLKARLAFCSTSKMVTPCAATSRTTSKILSTMIGDKPIEGSSSNSTLGRLIRARPIASICCSPPLMVPASWSLRSRRRGNMVNIFSMSAAISALSLRMYAPICKFSMMVMRLKTPRPSGTIAKPSLTRSQAPLPFMLLPKYSMSPDAGGSEPVMAFMVVVFPAPFEPISVTSSPSSTCKSTPLTALMPP